MNEKIIIVNDFEKNFLIKTLREKEPFFHYKFFSLNEFLNIYPYTYDNKALEYIMDRTAVSLEIAKIYLENLKYNISDVDNEKGKFLSELKMELLEKNLLQKNTMLENYLKKREIEFYNIQESKYLKMLLSDFNVSFINKKENEFVPKVYLLENMEEEIAFVGEKIASLIKDGVSLDNIFLSNIPTSYYIPLKRIFKMMHIPLSLSKNTRLNQTTIGRVFLENIDDLDLAFEKIKDLIKTTDDENIYKQILTIVNNHVLDKNKQEFIVYELQHTKVQKKKKVNCVHEIDFRENISLNDYCFILSFNKECIPHIKKDEDYLDDKTKEVLGIDTSIDINKREKQEIIMAIKNIKNCFITLKKKIGSKECFASELLELMNLEPLRGTLLYNTSHDYNKFILGGLLDKYVKYGTVSDTLLVLNKTYDIPYRSYRNDFTKIPEEKIWKKKGDSFHLSYTHLDTYNKCAFSYYIKHILNLDSFEETFQIKIGRIFHKVLENSDYEDFDFDRSFDKEKENFSFSKREEIFLRNLKEEFRLTIDTLNERKKFCSLTNNLREHLIEFDYPNKIKTVVKGIIDNVVFEKIDGNIYYMIVDYKTGKLMLEAEYMPLGFSLQLPTYLYLLKHDEYFKKAKLGGFYLQPLLVANLKRKEGEDFSVTKNKALKMNGYSTSCKEVLALVDASFEDSNCIKSLKVKRDGNFYNYSKILMEDDEEKLEQIVQENLEKGIKNITEGNFEINPKVINNKDNIACDFCPFGDLCYCEEKDNIYLESDKKFLKREVNNGLDEGTGNRDLYEWN